MPQRPSPFLALLLCLLPLPGVLASAQTTRRVSVPATGGEGDDHSSRGRVARGGVVVFLSDAANLVPGDTNGVTDVFVHDPRSGETTMVSVGPDGLPGDGPCPRALVTSDGRFVVFHSTSTNLVAGGTPPLDLVYVRDLREETTQLVSLAANGDLPDRSSAFLFFDISDDGRFVAFGSPATNLVPGDGNGADDVFVRDRDPDGDGVFDPGSATTTRVSVSSAGAEADRGAFFPKLTADGRFVVFHSNSTNLAAGPANVWDVFVRDRDPDGNGVLDEGNATTRRATRPPGAGRNGDSRDGAVSDDGRHVAFWSELPTLVPGDDNDTGDVFVIDLVTRAVIRASVSSLGEGGDRESSAPDISGDGRFVSFRSNATNLVPDDGNGRRDVFLHDRDPDGNGIFDEGNGTTTRQSVDVLGRETARASDFAALSADGRWLVFETVAGSLVPGDSNARRDVFLRDLVRLEAVPGPDPSEPGELRLSGAFGDEGNLALLVVSRFGTDFVGTSLAGSPPVPLLPDPLGLAFSRGPRARGLIDGLGSAVLPIPRTPPGEPIHGALLILDRRGRFTAVTSPVTWTPGQPGELLSSEQSPAAR